MGFRTGAYAKVWDVQPVSNTMTKVRISTSRKNKQTEKYEQDFSGFAACVGTAAAKKASCITEGSTIKIGDCEVTTKYDAEKHTSYVNYTIFSFEELEPRERQSEPADELSVDSGEVDDNKLPF